MKKLLLTLLCLIPIVGQAQFLQTFRYPSTYQMREDQFLQAAPIPNDGALLLGVTRVNGDWKNVLGFYHFTWSNVDPDDSITTISPTIFGNPAFAWKLDSMMYYTSPLDSNTFMATKKNLADAIASIPTLPSPTGNENKVPVVNGAGTGYTLMNITSLINSVVLSVVGNDSLLATITGLNSDSKASNKLSVPTGFGWSKTSIGASDRSLNTAYQISTTKYSEISMTVSVPATLTLAGGQTTSAILEWSPNGTTGWTYASQVTTGNTGTLAIGLNVTNTPSAPHTTRLEPGQYWRIRTTGPGTVTIVGGEQIIYN